MLTVAENVSHSMIDMADNPFDPRKADKDCAVSTLEGNQAAFTQRNRSKVIFKIGKANCRGNDTQKLAVGREQLPGDNYFPLPADAASQWFADVELRTLVRTERLEKLPICNLNSGRAVAAYDHGSA